MCFNYPGINLEPALQNYCANQLETSTSFTSFLPTGEGPDI